MPPDLNRGRACNEFDVTCIAHVIVEADGLEPDDAEHEAAEAAQDSGRAEAERIAAAMREEKRP